MNPETRIQTGIINYLNGQKILNWRMSGALNLLGFPDVLACYKGRFVALEVKTEKYAPTRQQIKVMSDIKKAGGYAVIVRSIEDVVKVLEDIDKDSVKELPTTNP